MRFVQEEYRLENGEYRWLEKPNSIDINSFLYGVFSTIGNVDVIDIFNEIHRYSKLSPCQRAKIGSCVIPMIRGYERFFGKNDYPVCLGDTSCEDLGCEPKKTCRITIHAEVDAMSKIDSEHDKNGYILFCSAVPCLDCAKYISTRNVKYVIFKEDRPQPEYDRSAISCISRLSDIRFIRFLP